MVVVIADSNTHVPLYIVGNGNRDCETEDRVRYAERVDVSIASEDFAGTPSCHETHSDEYRIGNVDKTEEPGAQDYSRTTRDQPFKTYEEI